MAAAKKLTFEEAMKRLEEIVSLLENGEADLESSLKLFAEGSALLGECRGKLDNAKLTVEKLFPAEKTDSEDLQ